MVQDYTTTLKNSSDTHLLDFDTEAETFRYNKKNTTGVLPLDNCHYKINILFKKGVDQSIREMDNGGVVTLPLFLIRF